MQGSRRILTNGAARRPFNAAAGSPIEHSGRLATRLEHAQSRPENGAKSVRRQAHLARVWTAASSFGSVPALGRPAVGREDIVGLYLSPPENAAVFCVDEKTAVQALERSQPLLLLQPRQPERRSHDYFRHGSLSHHGKQLADAPLDWKTRSTSTLRTDFRRTYTRRSGLVRQLGCRPPSSRNRWHAATSNARHRVRARAFR